MPRTGQWNLKTKLEIQVALSNFWFDILAPVNNKRSFFYLVTCHHRHHHNLNWAKRNGRHMYCSLHKVKTMNKSPFKNSQISRTIIFNVSLAIIRGVRIPQNYSYRVSAPSPLPFQLPTPAPTPFPFQPKPLHTLPTPNHHWYSIIIIAFTFVLVKLFSWLLWKSQTFL